jgi:hypothetical protein
VGGLGDRFQTTFLGSRAVTGQLVPLGMLDNEDQNGESLADVLYKHGFQGSEEALARTAYAPEQVRGCAVLLSFDGSYKRVSNSLSTTMRKRAVKITGSWGWLQLCGGAHGARASVAGARICSGPRGRHRWPDAPCRLCHRHSGALLSLSSCLL